MRYRTLGGTGIQVSPYALGALMLATSVGNPDPDDSARIIHRALDAGINLIDTSDAYGDSEEVVGRALEGRRDDVVLATKFARPRGTDPNRQGASRRWIMTAVEDSLRLLPIAQEAGLPLTHLAMAFAITHPGVTSALLGARTMEQLEGLLAGVDVVLDDDLLDRIDEVVPPGTDIGTLDQAYVPPALQRTELRRRPAAERAAA
jgi:aryl-alcohol dehydrogenase-like predicted oxidoreductase